MLENESHGRKRTRLDFLSRSNRHIAGGGARDGSRDKERRLEILAGLMAIGQQVYREDKADEKWNGGKIF